MSKKTKEYKQCRLRKPGASQGSWVYTVSWIPVDGAIVGKKLRLIEKDGEELEGVWEVESAGKEVRRLEDIISHDTKSYFPSIDQ